MNISDLTKKYNDKFTFEKRQFMYFFTSLHRVLGFQRKCLSHAKLHELLFFFVYFPFCYFSSFMCSQREPWHVIYVFRGVSYSRAVFVRPYKCKFRHKLRLIIHEAGSEHKAWPFNSKTLSFINETVGSDASFSHIFTMNRL